ncbi:WD domain, G-beta repeat [Planctomycetes bacterium MalM25]|nr:WD domain, G-beta repeat [Planctomycetes bacterium MalM25]
MATLINPVVVGFLLTIVSAAGTGAVASEPTYRGDVRKLLKTHCVSCHGKSRPSSDLDLSSYEAILAGSSAGEVVTPGDSNDSFLYLVTAHEEEPIMPPGGNRIPDEDLAMLKTWIELGAPFDAEDIDPSRMNRSDPAPATPPEQGDSDESDEPLSTTGRPGPIIALAASPDGKLIAIGDQLRVLIYDLSSQGIRGALPFPNGEPQTLRFSRDGKYLVVAGGVHAESCAMIVWSVDPFECVWRYEEDGQDVALAADLSPDLSRVVLGGPDRIVKLIDTATGELIQQSDKHTDWVLDARFGPAGLLYATGDRDGGVYVWESSNGKQLHSLRGHTDAVTGIAWHRGGDRLATASEDGTIRLWDMHTGAQVGRWTAHETGVVEIAALPQGGFWSIGRDSKLKQWSIDGEETDATDCREQPTALASTAAGDCVYGGHDGSLLLRSKEKQTALVFSRDHEPNRLAMATLTGSSKLPHVIPVVLTTRAADEGPADSRAVDLSGPPRTVPLHEALRANADQRQQLSALQAKFDEAVALYEDDPARPADLPRLFALTRASIAIEVSRNALEREELLRQRDEQASQERSDESISLTSSPSPARSQ